MQIIETPETFDVIVVGSGAGGGMASKILSESGLNVAVVEAGPMFDPKNDEHRTQLRWPWESPSAGS